MNQYNETMKDIASKLTKEQVKEILCKTEKAFPGESISKEVILYLNKLIKE